MIDFNKPVQTKDGIRVAVVTMSLSGDYPILTVTKNGTHMIWNLEGWPPPLSGLAYLENVPVKKHTVWIEVDDGGYPHLSIYRANHDKSVVARAKIEIEEGRFDT